MHSVLQVLAGSRQIVHIASSGSLMHQGSGCRLPSSSHGQESVLMQALSGQVDLPLEQVQDALGAQQDFVHEAKQRHPDNGRDVYASH